MRFLAFSVFDVKADTYSPPFWKSTVGQAVRDFGDLAQDKNTTVGRHPEDYKLVQVGEFDDATGLLIQGSQIVSLGFASDHVLPKDVVEVPRIGKAVS